MTETKKTFCRMCQAFCGHETRISDGRIFAVKGDRSDPLSACYVCYKGLHHLELYDSDQRLKRPLHKGPQGFEPGETGALIGQAGDRLARIVSEHGPEAVGFYRYAGPVQFPHRADDQ